VKKHDYRVVPYDPSRAEEWDRFVTEEAVNGTIWHTRRFLSYHPPGRFPDRSIFVMDGDTLAAVVPATDPGSSPFSHTGSTAGGPAVHPDYYRMRSLLSLVELLDEHYGTRLGMRLAESIFFEVEEDPILYAFGRDARVDMELGVYRPLDGVDDFLAGVPRARTRTSIRKLYRQGFEVHAAESDEEYGAFHDVLADNLERHETTPTHTCEELLDLRDRLGEDQRLLVGLQEGRIVGGTWMLRGTPRAWHTFYIAKDYDSDHAVTPALLVAAMEHARATGARALNFGICTEERGQVANVGLFSFKESLGGTGIMRFTIRAEASG
jgi:hypothetical protein